MVLTTFYIKENNVSNLRFVASDSWGKKEAVIKGFEEIVQGAITVAPQMRSVSGFNEYFGDLGG